jgi:hypothetical protein
VKAILVLAAVLLHHFAYEWAAALGDDPQKASSMWFYTFGGLQGVIVFYLLFPLFQGQKGWVKYVGLFAVATGFLEEAQVAVCGAWGSGITVPFGSALCIEEIGLLPYAAVLTVLIAMTTKGLQKNEEH